MTKSYNSIYEPFAITRGREQTNSKLNKLLENVNFIKIFACFKVRILMPLCMPAVASNKLTSAVV